jgi:hypothetical protein
MNTSAERIALATSTDFSVTPPFTSTFWKSPGATQQLDLDRRQAASAAVSPQRSRHFSPLALRKFQDEDLLRLGVETGLGDGDHGVGMRRRSPRRGIGECRVRLNHDKIALLYELRDTAECGQRGRDHFRRIASRHVDDVGLAAPPAKARPYFKLLPQRSTHLRSSVEK